MPTAKGPGAESEIRAAKATRLPSHMLFHFHPLAWKTPPLESESTKDTWVHLLSVGTGVREGTY